MQAKGKIGVTSENIFPVIKKFLYSEHDIFLREIVSNAIDATTKLKALSARGVSVGDIDQLRVEVILDPEARTLTIRDHGIGMTSEELDKYINQIAFSGAEDFLSKYKDSTANIIGHFGLGFYSAFMVSDRVEIETLSYQEGAQAVHWSCNGSPDYEMTPGSRSERGTDIIMHIDDESSEFLQRDRIQELLMKYCRFLPIPIVFGKRQEWKDGKMQDTSEDLIINETSPLWMRKPQDLKEEDYLDFYRKLYPGSEEPLFWIHLNVDYPFTLTGVLYFPKVKNKVDLQNNKIKLYCNQVYVTDEVENIVPMYLTLLHGVIDSPDIPLNVSRSYLQTDSNVKKISSYITKKVADRLEEILKNDRPTYEAKWHDLSIFIHYGILTDEKMEERAIKTLLLLEDVDHKVYTVEEYRQLITKEQTDRDNKLTILYASDPDTQYSYIQMARAKGYNVLLMQGMLDTPLLNHLEQKWEDVHFVRVDSDTIDQLIRHEEKTPQTTELETEIVRQLFSPLLNKEKQTYQVELRTMGADAPAAVVTRMEWMRRMKEMAQLQPGMSFYGSMPDSYALVLNKDHRLVRSILDREAEELEPQLAPQRAELASLREQLTEVDKLSDDEATDEEKQQRQSQRDTLRKEQSVIEAKLQDSFEDYIANHTVIRQVVDLALLSAGELKGEALQAFIQRTTDNLEANK